MFRNLRISVERAEELYRQLRLKSASIGQTTWAANMPENRLLNRWNDVLAYDSTRVPLRGCRTDYINANYVDGEDRSSYILTQGPLEETIGHFWTMVWQQKSSAIVMLCRTVEDGICKCAHYWPVHDAPVRVDESDLRVDLLDVTEDDAGDSRIRTMRVRHLPTDRSRVVTQYHFLTWPDFGVPEEPGAFLAFRNKISAENPSSKGSPNVVHCSAGIGRSGTYVLVDSCLSAMSRTKVPMAEDQVIGSLMEMRRQRMNLIQTPRQLWFAFLALAEGMKDVDFAREGGAKAKGNGAAEKVQQNGFSSRNGGGAVEERSPNRTPSAGQLGRKRSTDYGDDDDEHNNSVVPEVNDLFAEDGTKGESLAKRKRDC